jgi:hypothetical protein
VLKGNIEFIRKILLLSTSAYTRKYTGTYPNTKRKGGINVAYGCQNPYFYPAPYPAYPVPYSGGGGVWYALFIVLLILVLIFGGWWYYTTYC